MATSPKTTKKVTAEAATKPQTKKAAPVAETKASKPAKTTAKPATPSAQDKPEVKPAATKKAPAKKTAAAAPNLSTTDKQPEAPAQAISAPPAAVAGGKWGEIRQILLNMKEQTLLEIKRSIKSGSESAIGEEPTGDIYDQASSERDRELGLLLNDREREKLHNIDEALLRIDDGDYGQCEECDEEIPVGRLKVMPFTRHCVKCKSELEKFQAQTRRIEEDRAYREIPVGDDDEA